MDAGSNANAGLSPQNQLSLLALILAALSANLLYPGEVFFQAKYLLIFASVSSLLVVSASLLREGQLPPGFRTVFALLIPLILTAPSFWTSVNRSHSLEVLWLFCAYACLYASLRLMDLSRSAIISSLLVLTWVACVVSVHALYQSFFGLERLAKTVQEAGLLDESFRFSLLGRVSSKRVFANFTLPNTLAGFISMLLPINVFFLYHSLRGPGTDWPLGSAPLRKLCHGVLPAGLFAIQLILQLCVLTLTQSFGGWVCVCGSFVFLGFQLLRRRKIPWARIAVVCVALLGGMSLWLYWLSSRRGFALWDVYHSQNPISLRWINYETALRIFLDFPVTGVGLGNYGGVNPVYQSAPKYVTQYAHNTPLQLLSECGLFFLGLVAICLWWMARKGQVSDPTPQNAGRERDLLRTCLQAALCAWFLHNLLDIDFYFSSLGALGVFLLGILGHVQPRDRMGSKFTGSSHAASGLTLFSPLRRGILVGVFILQITLLFFSIRSFLAHTSTSLAIDSIETKNFAEAEKWLEWATVLNPQEAQVFITKAKIHYIRALESGLRGPSLLSPLRAAFERATRVDPYNSQHHFELSKVLGELNEPVLAEQARQRAIELFPSEIKYKERTPETLAPATGSTKTVTNR